MAELPNNPGYETTDAHISPLVKTGAFIFALMVASFVSMIVLFRVFNYYQPLFDDPVPPLAPARVINDSPRLQVDPPAQKIAHDRKTEEMLSSYGWVDPHVEVARIPIERAIELVIDGKLSLIEANQ
tara:strand:- start:95 stop:475 length:381 start_codon:yes stop_codon:yes gene_type:complete